MAARKDDDDRERLSWSEIDKRRDRSRHRAPASPRLPKNQAELARKQALGEAEALFKGKRGRPEYQKALKELEASHGTKKFAAVAKKFLEEYGLPEEWGALTRLLDYPEPQAVGQVLLAMAAQAPGRSRVEQQGFKGRVQVVVLSSREQELRRLAEEILSKF